MGANRPKVFGIGFQKTGTSSLAAALDILGYRTNHGVFVNEPAKSHSLWLQPPLCAEKLVPALLPIVQGHDALTDNPWPVLFRELDRMHPGAKFILTLREPESWIRSVVRHFGNRESAMMQWIYGVPYPLGHEAECLAAFEAHNESVRRHFADRPEDLLEIDFTNASGWEELCAFLRQPIPSVPFPHANEATWREEREVSAWKAVKHLIRPKPLLPSHTMLQLQDSPSRRSGLAVRLFWQKLLRVAGRISFAQDIAAAFFSMRDRATPLPVRLSLFAALVYFAMPLDLIPDFLGGIGFLDDAAVLSIVLWFASRHIGEARRRRACAALGLPPTAAPDPRATASLSA